MQTSSAAFVTAVTAGSVTWAPTRLRADWNNDGVFGTAGIDVLDGTLGDSWSVTSSLDEGLPSEVRDTQGGGVPDLTVALNQGDTSLPLASQYFSPFRTDSALYAYDRDVAGVYLNTGVVAGSAEYVRLFTGRMQDIDVQGRAASLTAVSAGRLAMAKLVTFPAVDGTQEGMNGTWPVLYGLYQCGLYASVPPRSNTRLWYPLAGSLREMKTAGATANTSNKCYLLTLPTHTANQIRPQFVTGPYTLGAYAGIATRSEQWLSIQGGVMAAGTDFLSVAGSTGRVEMWVRGDVVNYATPPSGSPWPYLARVVIADEGTSVEVDVTVNTNRTVAVDIYDGTNHFTLTSVATVPSDGAWYFVGGAYSFTEKKAWVNVNGTVTTSTFASLTTANLPARDLMTYMPMITSIMPIAEIQLSSGSSASPTNDAVWLNAVTWTQTASVMPAYTELAALTVTDAVEVFSYVSQLAQGELSAIGFNQNDTFLYWTQAKWAQDAQQTPVDTLSTTTNVEQLHVYRDPTRTRNSVRVSYTDTQVESIVSIVAELRQSTPIPPGETLVKVASNRPVVTWITTISFLDPTSSPNAPTQQTFYCLNDTADGSGIFTTVNVTVTFIGSGPGYATYSFDNKSGAMRYLVVPGSSSWPALGIAGRGVMQNDAYVTVQDDASIAARGERALTVTLTQLQSSTDALRAAQWLVDRLATPTSRVDNLKVFGDPRRQPGDLVTVADAYNTGASGNWRAMVIEHARQGPAFTQTVNVQQVIGTTGSVVGTPDPPDPAIVDQTLVAS